MYYLLPLKRQEKLINFFHLLNYFRFIQDLVEELRTKEKKMDVAAILEKIKDNNSSKLETEEEDQNGEELLLFERLGNTLLYLNGIRP